MVPDFVQREGSDHASAISLLKVPEFVALSSRPPAKRHRTVSQGTRDC